MRIQKLLLLIFAVCILGYMVKIIEYADDGASPNQGIELSEHPKSSTKGSEFTLTDLLLTGVPR
jgi:hypothetical protein